MSLRTRDFESRASASSTTPALSGASRPGHYFIHRFPCRFQHFGIIFKKDFVTVRISSRHADKSCQEVPSLHGSSSPVLHSVRRGIPRLCGDPRGVHYAHLRGECLESADLGDPPRRIRRPLRPPLRDRMEDPDLLGRAGPVPSAHVPHEQRAGRGLPGASGLDDTVHGRQHREDRRASPRGVYLRSKTVVRDRSSRGPGHAEATCPRGRAGPRACPPARVPASAPGRFRTMGGGPPPDDLRRGREAAVGRRPHS